MKFFGSLTILLLVAITGRAQFKFLANNCSEKYKAKIFVANCEGGICDGKATLIIYDKITDRELQTFKSTNLNFALNSNQNAAIGWLDLGKYQSPLVFGDFDFDGNEDVAIRNGNNGTYASPSFDVYLNNGSKFELNVSYTKLASENLGMFTVNAKSKLISIEQRDGCCYLKKIDYALNGKKGLTEVSSVIEDSTIGDEVIVITQKRINGAIKKTVQRFKTKEYYAEQ
ncbi:XAC2610-related protein [Pedobacter sandarakinus]|uniref:XAC2610-related protein n=1 Tax=Pedobacter sandarakinus TaxID=353156 RepID=UPI00224856FE|nr:hypothetical protein [Pedobacter sandarakinus]